MLTALAYLHERGICHRDVKMENIFLMTEDVGDAVLADFGYAVELGEQGCTDQICGSAEYASPEMWRRIAYTEKVDVWSLGVTMFVMLVGEFPYGLERGRSGIECIEEGVGRLGAGDDMGGLSLDCRHLLWRMLQIDPALRIAAADAREHEWFREVREICGKVPDLRDEVVAMNADGLGQFVC
jgi:serine/threonine protein kinase